MDGDYPNSRAGMLEASRWLAGGASSNFRLGVSPTPLVIHRAEGAYVIDADGNRMIDYYAALGPMILGHSPPDVIEAARAQMDHGILFGGQSTIEAEAARLVCEMVPSAERVRFCSSGSEADQAVLRLARAHTGRRLIVKFEGQYHGWFDNVLWSTTPPAGANGPVRGSLGQIESSADDLVVLPWNDLDILRARLDRGDIAGVLMEPAMLNQGAVKPLPGYLEGAREACARNGTLLIFDEVITGFRVSPGGAQQLFGVIPDLSTFAKAMANGFQVAAVVGRADVMELCVKGVVHGGTYNGQTVGMAACVATLNRLRQPGLHDGIARHGRRLMEGIRDLLTEAGIPSVVTGFPQVFHVAFGLTEPARNWSDLVRMDRARYVAFTTALLRRNVRALERGAWFVSTEHREAEIDATLAAVREAAREI